MNTLLHIQLEFTSAVRLHEVPLDRTAMILGVRSTLGGVELSVWTRDNDQPMARRFRLAVVGEEVVGAKWMYIGQCELQSGTGYVFEEMWR